MPSSALNTFMQWLGRSNALFRIAQAIPELHANPAAPLMLACWGLGEVIRYPWYALTEAGACPGWLTWLRYSAFVPVYPLGVAAEMALMWRALPLIRARRVFSLAMPNKLNFAFDYSIFMAVRNTVLCVWGGEGEGLEGGGFGAGDGRHKAVVLRVFCVRRASPEAASALKSKHFLPRRLPPLSRARAPQQIVLAAYPFLWWGLYSTLLRARAKKLGGGGAKKRE